LGTRVKRSVQKTRLDLRCFRTAAYSLWSGQKAVRGQARSKKVKTEGEKGESFRVLGSGRGGRNRRKQRCWNKRTRCGWLPEHADDAVTEPPTVPREA